MTLFSEIREEIYNEKAYTKLGVSCYVCETLGHISVNCPKWNTIAGNIKNVV